MCLLAAQDDHLCSQKDHSALNPKMMMVLVLNEDVHLEDVGVRCTYGGESVGVRCLHDSGACVHVSYLPGAS